MKSISNNILATIVAFYLSKFNDLALQKLGFKTYANAFNECAKLLNVKPNYIKLRRDELIVSAKRYHHSGVSGTIVSLEAVPL